MTPYQQKQRKRAAAAAAKQAKAPRLVGHALSAVRARLLTANNGGPVCGPKERADIVRLVGVQIAKNGGILHEPTQALRMLDLVLVVRDQKRQEREARKEARLPLAALQEAIDNLALKKFDARYTVAAKPSPMPTKGGVTVQMAGDAIDLPEPPKQPE